MPRQPFECHGRWTHKINGVSSSSSYRATTARITTPPHPQQQQQTLALTTPALICVSTSTIGTTRPKRSGSVTDAEAFYKAAFWLHHNHPKTLASNLLPIAAWFGYGGGMRDLVRILHRILAGQDEVDEEMMFAMADKVAVQRYETDPDYRLLHDLVSDLFAHCLNRDFQLLKKGMQMDDNINVDDHDNDESSSNKCFEITNTADWLDHRATFLLESVVRKVFQHRHPQRDVKEEDEEEHVGYAYRLREQLMKEVVEPLRKMTASDYDIALNKPPECNRWDYDCKFDEDDYMSQIYLEELKAAASKIENPVALLPHQIIRYVNDEDLGQVAELQWNAMLGDMIKSTGIGNTKKKKMNLNNSLAICDVCPSRMSGFPIDVSLGLGLLVSELSEEPAWKGKVINFSRNPQLHCIPQGDNLKAKCDFLRRMDCPDPKGEVDIQKVFDLILQVVVHGNLKPEQMINKVFVITTYLDCDEAWAHPWESEYEAIQSKFKEKGYGEVVPQIEYLDVIDSSYYENHKLVKWFLDTDGEILERDPEQTMEAEISPLAYQSLVVVD
ncbi:unnamed protein product [Prunus armeniaca]|uniref:Uncharacterized protein n=1 Tax=Prunus armeniaca TaxID=36596 RepID=A0A6J5UEH1_PRUAR|nr:unnamed protein product [Prunus armeniaca]